MRIAPTADEDSRMYDQLMGIELDKFLDFTNQGMGHLAALAITDRKDCTVAKCGSKISSRHGESSIMTSVSRINGHFSKGIQDGDPRARKGVVPGRCKH